MVQKPKDTFFIVTYRDPQEDKVLSVKARMVVDSSLGLSFVAISDFMFDTDSLVLNPAEEDQKKRFEGVRSLHLSIYTIISIEEVGADHKGLQFKKDKSNLVVLSSDHKVPSDK